MFHKSKMPLLERHHYFIYYHEEKLLPNYITNIWVFEMLKCVWGGNVHLRIREMQ